MVKFFYFHHIKKQNSFLYRKNEGENGMKGVLLKKKQKIPPRWNSKSGREV